MGKPPCCEMTFKAISDTPPDFTATVSFDCNKPANSVTISRVAETPPKGQLANYFLKLFD